MSLFLVPSIIIIQSTTLDYIIIIIFFFPSSWPGITAVRFCCLRRLPLPETSGRKKKLRTSHPVPGIFLFNHRAGQNKPDLIILKMDR